MCCLCHRRKLSTYYRSSIFSLGQDKSLGPDLSFFSCEMCITLLLLFHTLIYFSYSTLTKVLDVSICKSPVAG